MGEVDYYESDCITSSKTKKGLEMYNDDRYVETGLNISIYDLQRENTVLFRLEQRPHYTFTVFPGSSIKKPVFNTAYVRPTIPWSLKCDLSNKKNYNRADFMHEMKDSI